MFKFFIVCGFFFLMIFSRVLSAQPESHVLAGGINISDFFLCQKVLADSCPTRNMSCIIAASKKMPVCQQTLFLIKKTEHIPVKVSNFDNVNVVQSQVSDKINDYNYFMIGKDGELIMPSASLSLNKAPGFFDLNQHYSHAKLTNVILGFPEAIFLTKSIHKLLMHQVIIDPISKEKVGYAKVLYSFTINGTYQGGEVMRIILTP